MYRLYQKVKDRELLFVIPLVLLALAVNLGYFFKVMLSDKGFPKSDDSDWYLNYAHSLMADFRIGLDMNDLMYLGYNMLLTLQLAIFKEPAVVLFLQALTTGLSVILVYRIANILFNRTTAILASVFYCITPGIIRWTTYILTDSFFISLLLLCIYFLLMSMESGKRSYRILFVAASLYMIVFRPTGILVVVFILFYFIIHLRKSLVKPFIRKYKVAIVSVLAALLITAIYILTGDRLQPLFASLEDNAKMVLYNIYAPGWIYDHATAHDYAYTPDYTINIMNSLIISFLVNNWDHILILYGKRTISFLGWWVWQIDFKSITGVIKLVWYIIPPILFVTGTISAMINKQFKKASIIWLVILAVFAFCVLFFIDVMYRYKAPSLPFICIIAAYGADQLIRRAAAAYKSLRT
ncbi:MAG: hypothetical protein K0R67_3951 [Paenibacillus sp.]|nr:hypothetical protein [Paenibacillus sp.]